MAKPQYATLRFAKYKGPGILSNICRFVIEKGVLMWYHVDVTSRLLFNERRSKLGDKRKDTKGRVLKTGESQRKDGIYQYSYTDCRGKSPHFRWLAMRMLPERIRLSSS